MDEQHRLQQDPLDFSRFTRGTCRWFTGSGWRAGKVAAVQADRVEITATQPERTVFVFDARNVDQ